MGVEKRIRHALTGARTTIYTYVYDHHYTFRMPRYTFLIVTTGKWLDIVQRSCSVSLSHVIVMFRCASFEVAQCSKFCSYSALEHITVNKTNVTVLQLVRSDYKYGRAYVTRLRAGRSGVQIPGEGILFHSPKTSWAALECNQPLNLLLFADGAPGASR